MIWKTDHYWLKFVEKRLDKVRPSRVTKCNWSASHNICSVRTWHLNKTNFMIFFTAPDWALVSGWRLPGAGLCKENDKWVVQCDSSWWIKLQLRLILHTFYWLGVGGVGWRHWPGSRTHTQPQTWAHLVTVEWLILSSSRPRSNSNPCFERMYDCNDCDCWKKFKQQTVWRHNKPHWACQSVIWSCNIYFDIDTYLYII